MRELTITKPEQLKYGMWFTHCCHLCLWEIDSAQEMEHAEILVHDWYSSDPADRGSPEPHFWPTKRDALLDIKGWNWAGCASSVHAAIDKMLAEESWE